MELGFTIFISTLPFLFTIGQSIRFDIESGRFKCIFEDIRRDSMMVGHYYIVNPNEGHPLPEYYKINAKLFTGKKQSYHTAESVESGQFAFAAIEDGEHMICFSAADHQPAINISVDFNWRSGVTAKDWSNVAKKGSIDAMEQELKKMEDIVASIHVDMYLLRAREQEMQKLIRKTNSKMGYLSLVSLILCLSVAGLQLWHLKSFFEKQKII